jgi:hypothetical protein
MHMDIPFDWQGLYTPLGYLYCVDRFFPWRAHFEAAQRLGLILMPYSKATACTVYLALSPSLCQILAMPCLTYNFVRIVAAEYAIVLFLRIVDA